MTDQVGSVRAVVNGVGEVQQQSDYYAFGLRHTSTDFATNDKRYQLTGKESQKDFGFNYLDFHARQYDPTGIQFTSQDPLQDKYRGVSYYNYCYNNPVVFIDPSGMFATSKTLESPIFDPSGNFLGTDDEGIQGEAIIMNKSDFRQWMPKSEALKKGKLRSKVRNTVNQAALSRIDQQVASFPSRPDWDGHLTFEEARDWYNNGSGGDLYVSLSSLDLSWLRSLGKKYVGEEYPFNLFFLSPDIHTRLVYGNIRFKRYPNHQVRVFNDIYDFEFHPFSLGTTP